MKIVTSLADLSDQALVAETKRLARVEQCATGALIRSLVELDARRLYLAESCGSLFKYCTDVLHLSEDAAYNRAEVAAAARRHPVILDALEEGALTLTAARRLAPLLTADNCASVLAAAQFKNKTEIEEIIAGLAPKPDVKPVIRKLPQPTLAKASAPRPALLDPPQEQPAVQPSRSYALPPQSIVQALAPARFKVQFTIDTENA